MAKPATAPRDRSEYAPFVVGLERLRVELCLPRRGARPFDSLSSATGSSH
jgi:hypothetical protein